MSEDLGFDPPDVETVADPGSAALTETDDSAPPPGLEAIHDVPVVIDVILGRARMTISELLQLAPGDVVELDRKVGEPVDIMLGERLIARGELVVIDNRLGVTLTEMVRGEE